MHILSNPLPPLPPPKPIERKEDWTKECRAMFNASGAHQKRCEVADQLSVSVTSLEDLRVGVGRDEWNNAEFSSWPSRDHTGQIIGYVRRYADGAKRTNQGGSTGVFYTPNWCKHPGPVFIVEGGSDVAACESAGLCAIGRASNTHGGEYIKRMIEAAQCKKRIIVIGERDEVASKRGTISSCQKDCGGCAFCFPGMFGAKKVAAELDASWVFPPKPYKDMRELLTLGNVWLDLLYLF